MASPSYTSLKSEDDFGDIEDNEVALLPSIDSPSPTTISTIRQLSSWTLTALTVLSLVSTVALYLVASPPTTRPRNTQGLRRPNQNPQASQIYNLNHLEYAPKIQFPTVITRANEKFPEKVYGLSPHVVLSATDSMFFQWHVPRSLYRDCYIGVAMPDDPVKAAAANKTYTSSGTLEGIQVWKVDTPSKDAMHHLSWSTRPARKELLGTVSFYSETELMDKLGYEDGWQLEWPTPRFRCKEGGVWTIEITCESCLLEFDQVFSLPPLAFDLFQLA